MKKKITIIITLLIFIESLLYFIFGYIPIIGEIIATNKLSNYFEDTVYARYDWYNNIYVPENNDGYHITYNLKNNTIYDENYNKVIEREITLQYNERIVNKYKSLIFPSEIWIYTDIDADDKSLKHVKLYILGILEAKSMSELDAKSKINNMVNDFCNSLDYTITGIQLNYGNLDGMYSLIYNVNHSISNDSNLINNITRFENDKLPFDYLQWRINYKDY